MKMWFKFIFTKYLGLIERKTFNQIINSNVFRRSLCQINDQAQTNTDFNIKNKVYLSDSFTKEKRLVNYNQTNDGSAKWLSMYCCGPTVYEDSHLGHALTYIRCDLIRRVLHNYHNIYVLMAMNITDIDDKIISKANQTNSDFRKISNIYCNSFIEDMRALNVLDANCYLRVSDHIITITHYINTILDKGFAYISSNGDINFDFEHFIQSFNISNASDIETPLFTDKSVGKKSPKDFTLWKSAKPGEPKWNLITSDGHKLSGRPGWHIECSALAHKVFGHQIDLHFGGSDLRFPHHHNESCCTHAFKDTEQSNHIYGWVDFWLHSGHLNLNSQKMSKSLGNVILIKDFLKDYSPNILRLFCIRLHYRSDLVYEEHLLKEMKNTDKKLLEFNENLNLKISKLSSDDFSYNENIETQLFKEKSFSEVIDRTQSLILEGISDDLDLQMGLNAILDLAKHFNSYDEYISLFDLIRMKALLNKWTDAMGLKYKQTDSENKSQSLRESLLINSFVKFRADVRNSVLKSMKIKKESTNLNENSLLEEMRRSNQELLSLCDKLRYELDGFGIKLKDLPVSKTKL